MAREARLIVNIDVPDLSAAETFYGAVFGVAVGRRFAGGGSEMIGLPAPIWLLMRDDRDFARHWCPVHLDLAVDDLDEAIARAEAAGARIDGGVRNAAMGRIATFADPFGHGFCLIEFNEEGYDAAAD